MNSSLISSIAFALEPPQPSEAIEGIRVVLRDIAYKTALDVRRLSQETVKQALQMGQWLWWMQRDLKRKEYRIFLSILGWATGKARKFINLAKTFDGFEPSRLFGVELTTLLLLTSSRYSSVVAQLREVENITQELVEQLIKENRPPKKPKQDPISGWKQNRSGGGRHYNLNLHDEETGLSIEQQAETEGILPQRVVREAVALRREQKDQPSVEELRKQFQEELKAAVDEMRDRHIEMERQLIAARSRVAELEMQMAQKTPPQSESNQQPEPTPQPETKIAPDSDNLHSCITWEQISAAVGRDRSRLLGIVQHWSASERATLPPLLATYLEEKPDAFDETLDWTPFNLFKAALVHLTFTVQGIPGCRFVSLEYPSKDCELWLFADGENRLIPLSSRESFAVECF